MAQNVKRNCHGAPNFLKLLHGLRREGSSGPGRAAGEHAEDVLRGGCSSTKSTPPAVRLKSAPWFLSTYFFCLRYHKVNSKVLAGDGHNLLEFDEGDGGIVWMYFPYILWGDSFGALAVILDDRETWMIRSERRERVKKLF